MIAIPTNYNGHTFRSIMEARWAVFFDFFGFRWSYEPNGHMTNGVKYLPDFYLHDFDLYVEVKYRKNAKEVELAKKFSIIHAVDTVICDGNPHCNPLLLFSGSDDRSVLGLESKMLWFYKPGEGLLHQASEPSVRQEYKNAVEKANNTRFGVLELKNMLGKARKKEAFKLQDKLLEMEKQYNIPRYEIEYLVKLIRNFNEASCFRAFQEAHKAQVDGLSISDDQMKLLAEFDYNKGFNDLKA